MNSTAENLRIRVMLVDDHEGFRGALRSVLESSPWIELTEEAGSGEEALQLLETERPDVVLMDFSLPGMNGSKATREVVQRSDARVIGLSMHEKEPYAAAMREAGARAWLTKGGTIKDLLRTIQRVATGESVWD